MFWFQQLTQIRRLKIESGGYQRARLSPQCLLVPFGVFLCSTLHNLGDQPVNLLLSNTSKIRLASYETLADYEINTSTASAGEILADVQINACMAHSCLNLNPHLHSSRRNSYRLPDQPLHGSNNDLQWPWSKASHWGNTLADPEINLAYSEFKV